MPKVDLLNFIPVTSQKKKAPETILRKSAHDAAKALRSSCVATRAKSFAEWCHLIRRKCPIPHDHPYRDLLKSRDVHHDDALWIIGSIAFGCQPSSIIFNAIHWPDGTIDRPDRLHKHWLKK